MNKVRKFLASYEQSLNNLDPELIASHFPDAFMGADPSGVFCHRNDESLREGVLQRRAMYQRIGFKFGEILNVAETPIDTLYTMAKVHWRMVFEKVKGQPQEFKFFITYFLYDAPEGLRIVFFIAREDEQKVLREAGLLPMQVEQVGGRQVILH